LEEQIRLPIDQALDIAIAVCYALEVAHLKGIIHRDIKPSNILLCEGPEGNLTPKLCDFGIAHVPRSEGESPLTSRGDVLGTASYMSPEQIKGEEVDERSDIYSLGVLLYRMLTGKEIFSGNMLDIFRAQMNKKPCPPIHKRPEIPASLNNLVLRTLSIDPAGRYQKARDMRKALEQVRLRKMEKQERAGLLYDQGVAHLRAGKWQQALRIFEEIINLDPEHQGAALKLEESREKQKLELYTKGIEYLQHKQPQRAIEKLEKLVFLDINYRNVGGKLEEVGKQLELRVLYALGMGYYNSEQWSAAVAKFREVASLEDEYLDVASKLEEAEKQQEIRSLYQVAIREFELRNWIAAIEILTKIPADYRDAQARLREARKQQLYKQGLEHLDKKEWSKAIAAFQQVLKLDESFEQADRKLKEAKKQQELSGLYDRALKLERLEEWEEAYQLFHRILTAVSGYRDVTDRLARTDRLRRLAQFRKEADELWDAGRWQEAVDKLGKAVELDCRHKELDRKARRKLKSKLRTAKSNLKRQNTAYNKGVVFFEAQNWSRAVEEFQRVIDMNPNHQDTAAKLEEARKNMNQDEPLSTQSQPRATGRSSLRKKLEETIVSVIVSAMLGGLISGLVKEFLIDLDPIQLLILAAGITLIVIEIGKMLR